MTKNHLHSDYSFGKEYDNTRQALKSLMDSPYFYSGGITVVYECVICDKTHIVRLATNDFSRQHTFSRIVQDDLGWGYWEGLWYCWRHKGEIALDKFLYEITIDQWIGSKWFDMMVVAD